MVDVEHPGEGSFMPLFVVLFTFDMTAAWQYDAAVQLNTTGAPVPVNVSAPLIYGAIGTSSVLVSECLLMSGVVDCPIATSAA